MAIALIRKTALSADSSRVLDMSTVKAHLRVSGASEDALLELYRNAVEEQVGGPDGWLGRSLISDSFYFDLEDWPLGDRIYLPLAPLISVTAVTYRLDDGTTTETLSSSYYRVVTSEEPGYLGLNDSTTWPTSKLDENLPVRVEYVAGYANAAAVPSPIKAGMLLLIEDLYTNRGAKEVGSVSTLIADNPTLDRLLSPWRVRF